MLREWQDKHRNHCHTENIVTRATTEALIKACVYFKGKERRHPFRGEDDEGQAA